MHVWMRFERRVRWIEGVGTDIGVRLVLGFGERVVRVPGLVERVSSKSHLRYVPWWSDEFCELRRCNASVEL